jgi:hypothetical protein
VTRHYVAIGDEDRYPSYIREWALADTPEELDYAARRLAEYGVSWAYVRDASNGRIVRFLHAAGAAPVRLRRVEAC